jgi:hypothetical protein
VRLNKVISLNLLSAAALVFLIANACQRELHFDKLPAEGSLQKDASGNCKPVIIGGTFSKDKDLADTNFITVDVNVTRKGAYSIHTDTINGYWFSASGNFDNSGVISVKIHAHGKPLDVGDDQFTIKFNSSICSAKVPVIEVGLASFSFLGAPDRCRNAVVFGDYVKGVQLTNANTARVEVYVTSPGSYSFSSNVVNGYQFSSSGYLPNYGNQTLVLTASGSPASAGVDVFTINAGFSSCTIVDTVKDTPPVFNLNHFPIAYNSRWSYDDLSGGNDSVTRIFFDSSTVNGFLYNEMRQQNRFGTTNLYFRKNGNDYYDYGDVDRYTTTVSYSPKVVADIPFMKEGLSNNESWLSPTFTGVATFGQTILLRYSFTCTTNNGSVAVNGRLFNQVYAIRMQPQIASVGGSFGNTGEVYDLYYAAGVGLIYLRLAVNGITNREWQLRSWVVN